MNWIVKIIIDKEYPIIFNYKILKIWATIFNIIIGIIRFFDFVLFHISAFAYRFIRETSKIEAKRNLRQEFRDSEWRNKKVGRVIYMSGLEGEENKKRTKLREGFIDCSFRLLPHFRPARYFNQRPTLLQQIFHCLDSCI